MDYRELLKKRGKESKVYTSYQMAGLTLATILHDQGHKALYIKLAQTHDMDKLLRLAKNIAEKKDVKNRGAYFMRVLHSDKKA